MMQIMQPVMQINRTQTKAERMMQSMKRSNEDFYYKRECIINERELLKRELENL